MTQVSTARASALDLMHRGSRSTIAIGPISNLDPQVVTDRYTRLARIGPAARVGFSATSQSRWTYSSDVTDRVVVLPPTDNPQALLTTFREPGIERARVGIAGQYLLIDYNHGIGDIALLSRFLEVVLGDVDPQDPALWRRTMLPPLVTAAARTYADPRRLLQMATWYRRNRAEAPAPSADHGVSTVKAPVAGAIPAVAIARIPGSDLDDLRDWRDRHQPGVSVVALIVLALRAAFEKSGIEPADRVTLPFDARMYLPKKTHTLGNFAAGLDFDYGPGVTPQSLQAAITEAFTIGRPVANLLVSSLKVRAGRRTQRSHPVAEAAVAPDHRMSLLYSSLNTVPRSVTIPWDTTSPAQFLVASDPAGPHSITVTSAMADGDLTITAAFHDTAFGRQSVATALASAATDTVALLDDQH